MPNENESQETYGALDLERDSLRTTFVPPNQAIESTWNAPYFFLYGKDYSVYTHSFLCYGKDQALLPKPAKDILGTNRTLRLPHFNHGYNRVMPVSGLQDSPCTRAFETILPLYQLQI